MKIVFKTERLLFRELTPDDLDAVHGMLSDPAVMAFYPRLLSREESLEWIEKNIRRYREHGVGLWGMELREPGTGREAGHDKIIGQAGLVPLEFGGREELSITFLVRRDLWLRGYGTEAAIGCRDHVLGALGRKRVISAVRPENAASLRVLEKAGLKPAGECMLTGFRHLVYMMEV